VAPADIAAETSCIALAGPARGKAGQVDVRINCEGFFPTQPLDVPHCGRPGPHRHDFEEMSTSSSAKSSSSFAAKPISSGSA